MTKEEVATMFFTVSADQTGAWGWTLHRKDGAMIAKGTIRYGTRDECIVAVGDFREASSLLFHRPPRAETPGQPE